MSEVKLFEHPEFGKIRTESIKGEPWFCGKDVCSALGYKNDTKAIKDHCKNPYITKRYVGVKTGTKRDGTPAYQQIEMKFINEGNLYRLILKSQLPAAEKFESWVCEEVLPSLRKTGEYFEKNVSGRKKKLNATIDLTELLWLIDENLNIGDKSTIALKLGVSVQSVSYVLNGKMRSPRILRALYDKALDNRQNGLNVYSQGFIEAAVLELK